MSKEIGNTSAKWLVRLRKLLHPSSGRIGTDDGRGGLLVAWPRQDGEVTAYFRWLAHASSPHSTISRHAAIDLPRWSRGGVRML